MKREALDKIFSINSGRFSSDESNISQEPKIFRDPAKCHPAVYEHGITVGIFDATPDEANAYAEQNSDAEWFYDWSHAAGRVVMKRISRKVLRGLELAEKEEREKS